jgi:hypothetical protein
MPPLGLIIMVVHFLLLALLETTTLCAQCFLRGKFSQIFNLKSMILTCTKDVCEDLIHNTTFNSYFLKIARILQHILKGSQDIERFLKISAFICGS